MAGKLEKLSKQEEAAMLAIWGAGKGVAREILEHHQQPQPHYNTLVSTIKNLIKKSFVGQRVVANANEYYPLVKEADYKKQFVTSMVKNHFSNSYKELVSFFAEEKKISTAELKEIINMIEKKKVMP